MEVQANDNIKTDKRERLRSRITEIDLLRGICVFLMVFDHIMVDLWYFLPSIFNGFPPVEGFWYEMVKFAYHWWVWPVRIWVRNVIVFFFLALTGISCSFSKSNLKRGLFLTAVALALSLVTFILGKIMGDPDMFIAFGILNLISLCIVLIALIEKLTQNKWVYLAIGATMMIVGAFFLKEVDTSYSSGNFFVLFFKAFIGLIIIGPDCYSFLFYGGQIFIGVFLGKLLYPERKPLLFKKGYSNNFVTFTGRHSLFVYIAHQVVVPLVLALAVLISGFQLSL